MTVSRKFGNTLFTRKRGFFLGEREQRCITCVGDTIISLLITVSGRIDAGSLLAVMGAR